MLSTMVDRQSPAAKLEHDLREIGATVESSRAKLVSLLRLRNALMMKAHAAGWTLEKIGAMARPIKPLSKQAVQKVVHSGEKRGR